MDKHGATYVPTYARVMAAAIFMGWHPIKAGRYLFGKLERAFGEVTKGVMEGAPPL